MKNKISTYILNSALGLVALFITQACAPKIDDYTPSTGTQANFDKYIAVGNSLTAGYADDGLYLEGQKVAYPNLIAQQLQQLGKAKDFNSPFFPEGMENGSGYLQLVDLVNGQPVLNKVNSNLAY
ncbi:MAG TPA: G-D-S-L family lipolytic protein, partial [Candidatus Sphingobacterium stercoripullorum]|nr:G-D-S-L family lipolytic protein [Candidatus Sphingobacterium stercoripullorum]